MGQATQGQLRPIENAYPRLLGAMDSQVRLLFELESGRDEQRAAIEGDDPESMLAMFDERQKVIDALTALDRDIAGLRAQVESLGSAITQSQREEITRRAGSVAQSIRRVLAADAEDGEALERRRLEVSRELGNLSDTRRAAAAYGTFEGDGSLGAGRSPGARFQDRRG
jgi:hypothetical protein